MDNLNYGYNGNSECGIVEEDGEEPYFRCESTANIAKGDSLVWRYSDNTCRENAVRSWGFYVEEMEPCNTEKPSNPTPVPNLNVAYDEYAEYENTPSLAYDEL